MHTQRQEKGRKPTVIILHGIAADHRQLRLLEQLSYDTILVDLPGHGKSEWNRKGILDQTAQEIKELIEGLEEYVLLGYSLGGYIVQDLLQRGLKPKAAVLISTGSTPPYKQIAAKGVVERAEKLLLEHKEFIKKMLDGYRKLRGQQHIKTEKNLDLSAVLEYLKELEICDYKDAMSKLDIPVLVIQGDKDLIVPRSYGEQLARIIPNAIEVEIKADHLQIVEKKQLLQETEKFLAAIS